MMNISSMTLKQKIMNLESLIEMSQMALKYPKFGFQKSPNALKALRVGRFASEGNLKIKHVSYFAF